MSLKHQQNSTRLHDVTSQNVPLIWRETRRVVTSGYGYQGGQPALLLDVCSSPDTVEICLFTTWLAKCLNIPISSDRLYGPPSALIAIPVGYGVSSHVRALWNFA